MFTLENYRGEKAGLIESIYNLYSHKIDHKITIAIFSDTHGVLSDRILISLKEKSPDFIAIPGDLVDNRHPFSYEIKRKLYYCREIAPIYFSFGNHDYVLTETDTQEINDIGIKVLDNEWSMLKDGIFIGGFTSANYLLRKQYGIEAKMNVESDIHFLKMFSRIEGMKILLDHHPENYPLYTKKMDIDLILSGHTHGGQIGLFGHGLYAHGQGFFPKYSGGLYDDRLVVSRGMSNVHRIPRIGNPTEITYVVINE